MWGIRSIVGINFFFLSVMLILALEFSSHKYCCALLCNMYDAGTHRECRFKCVAWDSGKQAEGMTANHIILE